MNHNIRLNLSNFECNRKTNVLHDRTFGILDKKTQKVIFSSNNLKETTFQSIKIVYKDNNNYCTNFEYFFNNYELVFCKEMSLVWQNRHRINFLTCFYDLFVENLIRFVTKDNINFLCFLDSKKLLDIEKLSKFPCILQLKVKCFHQDLYKLYEFLVSSLGEENITIGKPSPAFGQSYYCTLAVNDSYQIGFIQLSSPIEIISIEYNDFTETLQEIKKIDNIASSIFNRRNYVLEEK